MLDWYEILTRIGAAAVIGAALGLNRHRHRKSSGLRTLSLVACGAAGLVLATLHAAEGAAHIEATSRVIQGIMTGVGFIGAGVIMRNQGDDKVHGLTTAAAIWITAALGALCGIGAWKIIFVLSFIVILVLLTGGPIERWWVAVLGDRKARPNGAADYVSKRKPAANVAPRAARSASHLRQTP